MTSLTWDRRRFIKSTAATAAIIALAQESLIPSLHAEGIFRKGLVLYDPRSRDSVVFAQNLRNHQGAREVATDEDIGRAWSGRLAAAYAACEGILCGLTSYSDFMISRIFARDIARGRLSFEGLHDNRPGKRGGHRLRVAASGRGLASDLSAAGDGWAGTLAAALCRMTAPGEFTEEWCESSQFSPDHRDTLFSWVITKPQAC